MDIPQRRRSPVHDPQDQLEAEANARVSNESFARDPEVQKVHDTFEDPN